MNKMRKQGGSNDVFMGGTPRDLQNTTLSPGEDITLHPDPPPLPPRLLSVAYRLYLALRAMLDNTPADAAPGPVRAEALSALSEALIALGEKRT